MSNEFEVKGEWCCLPRYSLCSRIAQWRDCPGYKLAVILFEPFLQVTVKAKSSRSKSYLLPGEQILKINLFLWLFSIKPQQFKVCKLMSFLQKLAIFITFLECQSSKDGVDKPSLKLLFEIVDGLVTISILRLFTKWLQVRYK